MNPRCPICQEWTVVCRIEETMYRGHAALKVTNVLPPPYCPMCGHPWWRDELGKEAERIANGEMPPEV